MLEKLNVYAIIRDHVNTLEHQRSRNIEKADIVWFYVLPIFAAAFFVWRYGRIGQDSILIIVTSLTIFAGLLFNLLLLLADLLGREADPNIPDTVIKRKKLRQSYYNISYCILISFLSIVALVLVKLLYSVWAIAATFTFLSYFLVLNFALTFLMVLKRTHALLSAEVSDG